MNSNARKILDYLTNNPDGCERDELEYMIHMTSDEVIEGISGDAGLTELRMIFEDPASHKITCTKSKNMLSGDGASDEDVNAWLEKEFLTPFSVSGIKCTVVKMAGNMDARIYINDDVEIGAIMYATDSRHPWYLDEGMPRIFTGTNLKPPSVKTKFSGKWKLPEGVTVSYSSIFREATKMVNPQKSNNAKRVILRTCNTLQALKFRSLSIDSVNGTVRITKDVGANSANVFINNVNVGIVTWEKTAATGIFRTFVRMSQHIDNAADVMQAACDMMALAIGNKITNGFENKPFENL